MARTRYKIIDNNTPYFLTITVVNWIPLLSSPIAQQILLDALRFLQEQERLVLYAYVILENHLHLVASSVSLSKEIGDFKSYTARQLIDYYERVQAHNILKQLAFHKKLYKHDRDYQLWQEGSHPQRIQDIAMLRQMVEYIHQNPVQRGWVDTPTDWRLSSARNYAGKEGVLAVQTQWQNSFHAERGMLGWALCALDAERRDWHSTQSVERAVPRNSAEAVCENETVDS